MEKYFYTETDESVSFGDVLRLVLNKNIEGGKVTIEKDVEINESTLDFLIEIGVIEAHEIEEEEHILDFDEEEPCSQLAYLIEDFERLEKRTDELEELTNEVCSLLKKLVKKEEDKEEKKNAQPKKK